MMSFAVACRPGVSPATVSRVLTSKSGVRSATRERVRQVIAVLGFVPDDVARGLVTRQPLLPSLARGRSHLKQVIIEPPLVARESSAPAASAGEEGGHAVVWSGLVVDRRVDKHRSGDGRPPWSGGGQGAERPGR